MVDGKTGAIKDRKDFYDRHVIDRVVGTGIAAHEGQLFGWPNQLLGRITAAGLILLCTSSVVMWWRRRDVGVLGAPKAAGKPRLSLSFLALVILLGVYRPLFGAPLLAVLLVEKRSFAVSPGFAIGWVFNCPASDRSHRSLRPDPNFLSRRRC